MKLFLDDIRNPSDCAKYMHKRIGALNPIYTEGNWYIVRNYDQFINAVIENIDKITHISFDHDLADDHYDVSMYHKKEQYAAHLAKSKEKTGYDCATFTKYWYSQMNKPLPVMFVHSMNPVGTENIINVFK